MNKQQYDIIIFAGQSNMQGETEGLPLNNEPVRNALEYRFLASFLLRNFPLSETGFPSILVYINLP